MVTTRTCSASANEDFINLSGYSEILVLCHAITKAASGTLECRVSTDNGSTFLSASGEYISVNTSGTTINDTSIEMHATASAAARYGYVIISGFNTAGFKLSHGQSNVDTYFIPTTTPLNAVRVFGSAGGNLTGGTIYLYGRI